MPRRQRASLYARLSRAADDSNVSLDGMIQDMRDLCTRLGLEEAALHVDDGLSGGRRDRDEFQAWVKDARTGAADVLVAYSADRLTREGLNVAASLLDVVEGKDPDSGREIHRPVRLVDCQGIDSEHGDAFRFRFVIQAEVGRAERERMRSRARAKSRRLRTAGRWPGGTPPYGYRSVKNPDGPGYVLELAPAEAAALQEAADAVLGGDNLTRVVRRMNHAGVLPRRAKAWSRVTLRQALIGDAVLGRLTVKGKPVRDDEGEIVTPFPAVLTEGVSAALRACLEVKTPDARKGGRRPARLLSGLLSCHACGTALQVARRSASAKAAKQSEVTYRCPTKANGGVCARPVSVSAKVIEEHVQDRYLSAVGAMPMYREKVIVAGVDELAAVESDLKDTMADLATKADAATFARLQRLQARRDELAAVEPERKVDMVPTGLTMAEHWAEAMTDDRRTLLDDAIEELVLLPGQRGPRGFDPKRLVWRWREEPDAEDDSGE